MPDINTRTKNMCGFIQFKGYEPHEIDVDSFRDFFGISEMRPLWFLPFIILI